MGGCSQTVRPNATPAKPGATLTSWPRSAVNVTVEDSRPDKRDESASVVSTVKESIEGALAPSGEPGPRAPYSLKVLVSEYRGFFTMGHWNGVAKLKAVMTDSTGATVREWSAEGQTRKMNMMGKSTANAAAREALQNAIADLTAQLALVQPPR
jgi:hypothetical protein